MVNLLRRNGVDAEELFEHDSLIRPYRTDRRRNDCRIEAETAVSHRRGGVNRLKAGEIPHASIYQQAIPQEEVAVSCPVCNLKSATLAVRGEGTDDIENSMFA